MSGVTLRDSIRSEEIRKKWNVEEMIDDIQKYQLKWNERVLRMPENRIPRKVLQYRPQLKRGFRKTLPSLERPVHAIAELELNPKLLMEEEEEEEEEDTRKNESFYYFTCLQTFSD